MFDTEIIESDCLVFAAKVNLYVKCSQGEEEKLIFVPHFVCLCKHGCAQKARDGLDVLFCGGKDKAERQEQNKGAATSQEGNGRNIKCTMWSCFFFF